MMTPLALASLAAIDTSTPAEVRAMLVYVSGYAPDAFAAALLHLSEFPVSTPQDEHTPRHSAAHRGEVAA